MKLPTITRRTRTLLLVPAIALALALMARVAVQRLDEGGGPVLRGLAPQGPLINRSVRKRGGDKLGDSLLTDSILSIVQSYYVDQERVDNKSLLVTALQSLSASPRVRSGADDDGVWIEIDEARRSFALADEPRYQDVLEIFAEIGQMLDEADVTVAHGEGPVTRATPGSVTLLNAMLAELDAHSTLLSPEAYKELRQGTEGSFGGLGVLVGIRDNLLTVIKPLPRSPAQRAGIRKHDKILGIDGVFTYGSSLDELVEHMRGDPGTEVNLSLLRDGSVSPSEIKLTREVIHVDSVMAQDVEQGGAKVLHLTIENFSSRTSREVLSAIKKARQRNGGRLSGLVLDLRSNPGGLLDQAVQVADLFLKQGVIVTTKGRREEVETAGSGFDELSFPVVVLIDGDSASASEIVAGALQDHGRALVVGQPSFGKGSVQTIFELPGERALKLTIARYYTPAGRTIQNVGIIPDVWLQPVQMRDANLNLFGSYRYKNERFLKNHLDDGAPDARRDATLRWPARKAYYLTDADLDEDAKHAKDRELDVALTIMARLHATYGDRLPESAQRASHWLGLAGPEVSRVTAALDRETSTWLKDKQQVTWSDSPRPGYDAKLELAIGNVPWAEVEPGRTVSIAWRLVNREERAIERVSVFVRSEVSGFETKEVLVGGIPEGGSRKGTLEVQIPAAWPAGPLVLRVGAAVDAWPARAAVADVPVQVVPRRVAALEARVALDAEVGGSVPGVLEAQEKARLTVKLKNVGEVPAKGLLLRVVNLSGHQVRLREEERKLDALAPGDELTATFRVDAARALHSDVLAFGISAESADLKAPLRQRITIPSRPSGELTRAAAPTSH